MYQFWEIDWKVKLGLFSFLARLNTVSCANAMNINLFLFGIVGVISSHAVTVHSWIPIHL